ncbi:MAG: sodium-dependent transporter [Oscillospiraceae bacterium]|nr:sodium-dependent transporter [Oscillospiraceae bacterium]
MSIQPHTPHKNGSFSSSLGFILACVGSAVGLGNIWMFPYRLGQYGGAAFLIPYIFFICLFGLTGLSAEFAIGRMAKTGTLGSYALCWKSRKKEKFGKVMGWIPLLGSLGIAIGYSIIIGWVVRSLFGSITNDLFAQSSAEYFAQATTDFGSLPWHILVIAITLIILLTGSVKQIEKANKIMMPVFFCLFAFLAIRVAMLPGASAGYEFLFIPDWKALAKTDTWIMAMGQAFFSLSITGSGMIVYGSYLGKNEDITKASIRTAFFDTVAALLAALAIMPAVFAFQIKPNAGPSLMFLTIPEIFRQMPAGRIFSVIFFLSVSFAGITSLINMFEAVIESWQHRFHLNRKLATLLCGAICLGVGIFLEAEPKVGNWMDFITILVVPFGALFGAFSIYYVLGYKKILAELNTGRKKPLPSAFGIIAKYIYVPLTVIVFILGIIYKGIG